MAAAQVDKEEAKENGAMKEEATEEEDPFKVKNKT